MSELIKSNLELKIGKIKDFWAGPHQVYPEIGKQILIRFDNGYGVSVVQFYCPLPSYHPMIELSGSYGVNEGLYELAVVKFEREGDIRNFEICYDTPIADDVMRYLSEQDVIETAIQVSLLEVPSV